jgi:hypothetical protein
MNLKATPTPGASPRTVTGKVLGEKPPAPQRKLGAGNRKAQIMTDFIYTLRRSGAIPPTITGDQIARKRLTKRERAEIAGAAMDGRTQLTALNQRQIAAICGISLPYARLKMRRPQSAPALQAAE